MIKTERVYGHLGADGTARFLVERLWPRGIKKEALSMSAWCRDVAPSAALRKWFNHDPAKWKEFERRYRTELKAHAPAWHPLLEAARAGVVTLLFSARDVDHNNAIVLGAFLTERLRPRKRSS